MNNAILDESICIRTHEIRFVNILKKKGDHNKLFATRAETLLTPYRKDRYHQKSKYMYITYFHVHARPLHSLKERTVMTELLLWPHNNKTHIFWANTKKKINKYCAVIPNISWPFDVENVMSFLSILTMFKQDVVKGDKYYRNW